MTKITKNAFEYLAVIEAVISTREIILKYFQKDLSFDSKKDDSPVTKADLEVNSYLNSIIQKSYPNSAIISEENNSTLNIKSLDAAEVFIIDPLDGTSAFIKGSKEFTVNVGLKVGDNLTMGIIYSPIEDILHYAENRHLFKILNASKVEAEILQIMPQVFHEKEVVKVIATRREEELNLIKKDLERKAINFELVSVASSLKFCHLAEGVADIYYRLVSIKLWDVAAGFAIVKAAGFNIIDHSEQDLLQNIFSKEGIKNLQENDFKIPTFIVKKLNEI